MSDAMTFYTAGKEEIVYIEAKPDPKNTGKYVIQNAVEKPLCCELSLQEHAYNIVLLPGSFVVINADNSEVFKASQSDDHVTFCLPTENTDEVYAELYYATIRSTSPHKVLALRYLEGHHTISAALYPRDLDRVPPPAFRGKDGGMVSVNIKGMEDKPDPDAPIEYAHFPEEMEIIVNAIYKPTGITVAAVDPNAPKEDWF